MSIPRCGALILALAAALVLGCDDDRPLSAPPGAIPPNFTHTFTLSPVRSPGGHADVHISFELDPSLSVQRTALIIADTDEPLLPSPWGSLYKINGNLVYERRDPTDPGRWEAELQFDNESQIVCDSCEDLLVEYQMWD